MRTQLKLFWMIIAGLAIATATVLLFMRDFTTAFVVAAIGLIAWFLNYRMQMKDVLLAAELEHEKQTESEGPNDD
ncbi:MAG TPA: hypothetical protein VIB00_13415 [Pyrinomonadaceae bacterium]|jgi:hypothetical protein